METLLQESNQLLVLHLNASSEVELMETLLHKEEV